MRACALALAAIAVACRPDQQPAAAPAATPAAAPTATATGNPTATANPPPTPTATPTAGGGAPEAAVASPTGSPPPSAAVLLRAATAIEPGGRIPLGEQETVVDPAARFEVELAAPCPDARLVLLDAQDALVASSGASEIGAATRLTLTPAAPLRPASRYTLRIDGASTRELHDATGRAFGPATRPLLIAGSPPPPEPKKPPRRRRR